MKDYYIEGADRYSDATEGRTRISELEMLYKAFRLAKRKNLHQDCKPLKWKAIKMESPEAIKMESPCLSAVLINRLIKGSGS